MIGVNSSLLHRLRLNLMIGLKSYYNQEKCLRFILLVVNNLMSNLKSCEGLWIASALSGSMRGEALTSVLLLKLLGHKKPLRHIR